MKRKNTHTHTPQQPATKYNVVEVNAKNSPFIIRSTKRDCIAFRWVMN